MPPVSAITPSCWRKCSESSRAVRCRLRALPRPDVAAAAGFSKWLETALDAEAAAHPNPGHPAIHRLNRAEYSNAIRDIFELDVNAGALLPVDDSGYGFDNNGDVLSLSPTLLDSYLSAARKISRLAV